MTTSSDPKPLGTSKGRFVVRADGNDANGGAYNLDIAQSGSVDRSTTTTPYITIDGSDIIATQTGSKQLTLSGSVGHTVSNADTGNFVFLYFSTSDKYIQALIKTVNTTTNTWNMEHGDLGSVSTSETGTGRMGGALASPGEASARMSSASGDAVYVKTGTTYTLTSSSLTTTSNSGVSGGPVYHTGQGNMFCAFHTTPGDFHTDPNTRVQIDTGSTTSTTNRVFYLGGKHGTVVGFEIDGNDNWNSAFHEVRCSMCKAQNFDQYGFENGPGQIQCAAVDCATAGFYNTSGFESVASGCATGFTGGGAFRCAAYDCSSTGFAEANDTGPGVSFCVADSCGTGFSMGDNRGHEVGNVATNCTTGCSGDRTMHSGQVFYNNTTNVTGSTDANTENGFRYGLQLTAAPFEDAANLDFSLNSDSGGGADLVDRLANWGSGAIAGPQQQQTALVESSGGGGGGTTVPQGLHSIESGINA